MKKVVLIALVILLSNCVGQLVVQNPCTTVEKISNLHEGMLVAEVSNTLGVDPKEVYSIIENQTKVLLYSYKLEYQQINAKREKYQESLRGGSPRFKDENDLYVVFDARTNKMLFYVTDKGRKLGSKKMKEALKIRLLKH